MRPLPLAAVALLVSAPLLVSARRAPGDTRPNFIFHHPDTIRADALSAYGHPFSQTPNYDRLARQGVLFEEAHAQHSQCGPSRCAMLTGRYMHVYGHRTQTNLVKAWEDNLFAYLKASGYTTIMLGKNDVFETSSFNTSLTFWQDVEGVEMGSNAFAYGEAGYYSFASKNNSAAPGNNSNFNGDLRAVELTSAWLLSDPPEPFLVYLPGIGAHPPYGAPKDYYSLYTPEQVLELAPPRARKAGDGKPPHLDPDAGIPGYRNLTSFNDTFFASLAAVYLGRVAFTDYVLGQLLDGIEASPLASSTVIVSHSDHGDYEGDYRLVEKWPGGLEDELTHVPLLVSVPGGAQNKRVAEPVMSIDLFSTLLDLAGVQPNGTHFGVSLSPFLASSPSPPPPPFVRDPPYVFSEGGYSNKNEYEPNDPAQRSVYADPTNLYFPRGREEVLSPLHIDRAIMMRNATAKLVYRPRGVSELYDLAADPLEEWNVYANASAAALRADMTADLLSWLVLTSDVTPAVDDPRGLPPSPVPPFPWPPKAFVEGRAKGEEGRRGGGLRGEKREAA